MSGDQIWPILFAVSACINVVLVLRRPVMKLLRREGQVSEDNIMAMVEEGEESGAIQANEKEFIENVFEFDNMTARDVMIHRTDMVTLSLEEEPEKILDVIRQSGLSRPVHPGVSAQLPPARPQAHKGAAAPGLLCSGDRPGGRAVPGYAGQKDPHGPGGG